MKNAEKILSSKKATELMPGITKSHIRKAAKLMPGVTKSHIKKAMVEHHYLGQLIGAAAKGLGMMAPHIGTGLHGIGALGALAQTGLGLSQMRQANRAAAAQERLMNAQAQGAEKQNAYFDKQMAGLQPQKKGGRTKSCSKNFR